MTIAESLARLEEEIEGACRQAGRRREEVTLVAVSKTVTASRIREAYAAGQREFGENRVQELLSKSAELRDLGGLTWHMVGHLQTNKVRALLPALGLLHSLDRIALAQEIDRLAAQAGPGSIAALVQVNTTGEATKSGVDPEALDTLVDRLRAFPSIALRGLMTIGPLGGSEAEIRRAFARLRHLRDHLRLRHPDLGLPILSMGMSDDFPLAIEEGATHLRVGSRIFGPRE